MGAQMAVRGSVRELRARHSLKIIRVYVRVCTTMFSQTSRLGVRKICAAVLPVGEGRGGAQEAV